MIHDIWEFRNSVVTKVTQEKASMSERNKMAKEVRKQFEMGCSTLRPKDHYLLECTLDSVLQKTVKSQRYWVRKCIVSREYTDGSEKNMLEGMRSIMNAWAIVPD